MYVLMVVPSNFPNGDAGAVRDMAFANIYQEMGYEVVLVGAGRNQPKGIYHGIYYYSVYQEASTSFEHLKRFLFSPTRYKTLIENIINDKGLPKIVHINDISEKTINYLLNITKVNQIPMLHDSTEWYSPCEFPKGKLDKAYLLKDRLNRKIIKAPIKVIGISKYLTEYFISRGLAAVRIPVIMDVANTQTAKPSNSKIVRMIYAGSPARKDYLREIILGSTALTSEEQKRIELHLFGVNEPQVMALAGLKEIPPFVQVYGRVPRQQVEEVMNTMDFSLLLRPAEERYTKAGFPTKSVEAMSHGVAMICNLSSDLDMYLEDGKNSVIVKSYNEEALTQALRRVLNMSREEIEAIKKNARLLAEREFDYRGWIHVLSELIGDV